MPKTHYLFIFILGLFSGLLLHNTVERSLHLTAHAIDAPAAFKEANSKRELPIVAQVIERDGYTVCYDGRSKNPYYVVEVLTADSLKGSADRSKYLFREDENISEHLRATLDDYKYSGYDRGHMAPAADCRKNVKRMEESFFLSNVCPQNPHLNRVWWLSFEKHVRDLTKRYSKLEVFTGPLYLPVQGKEGRRYEYPVIGKNDVAVPTHFYKIIRMYSDRVVETEAYIVPNESIALEIPLGEFQATVEKVERVSGILF